jgi:hypothetical protein
MLKKLALLSLLLTFSVLTSRAQLRVGPKVGVQLSRVAFDDKQLYNSYSSTAGLGWLGGLILNYEVNELLSLETEFFYSKNHRHLEGFDAKGTIVTNKSTYNYLNLPVLLRFSGHTRYKKSKIEYYTNFGPNLLYWLGGKGELTHPDLTEYVSQNPMPYTIVFADSVDDYTNVMLVREPNRFQMAFDVGGGLIFDLGFGHGLVVDLRGSFGIGKTYMAREDGFFNSPPPEGLAPDFYTDPMQVTNHSLAITVGYMRDFNFYAWLRKGKRAKTSH